VTPFGQHPCDGELARYVRLLVAELRGGLAADACGWSGRIEVLPLWTPRGQPESRLGFADWDGTMGIRADLVDALRSMWAGSSGAGGPEQLRQRDALHTVRHEAVHFLHLDGQPYRAGEQAYRRWAVRLLEEGVTEAVAQNHRLAGAVAAEARSPGLARLPIARTYREFTPAVRHLAQYVGGLHRKAPSAVLDDLGRRAPHAKYPTLTRTILEAGGLWEQIPEAQRPACRRYVENEMSNVAWQAHTWARRDQSGRLGTSDPDGHSHVLGLQMVAAASGRGCVSRAPTRHRAGMCPGSWRQLCTRTSSRDRRCASPEDGADVRAATARWREAARAELRTQLGSQGPPENVPPYPDQPRRNGPAQGAPPAAPSRRPAARRVDRSVLWPPPSARRARDGRPHRDAGR
jgi:hypothetical protein